MNDDELDRMVAGAAPITDGHVASLGLRDAATELLEEIMATTTDELQLARDPRPPGQRRRTRYRALAAAGAVVALGTAAVLGLRAQDDVATVGSDSETPPATADLPRLVPGDLPAGLALDSAYEFEGPRFWDEMATYGRDLAISWTRDGTGSGIEPGIELEQIAVRGHQGHACTGATCAQLGLSGIEAGVEWIERPGLQIYLASPSLTVDHLLGIADGLVVDGDDVAVGDVPDDLPVELGEPGRVSSVEDPDDGDLPQTPGVDVIYRLADPSAAVRVTTKGGDAASLAAELTGEIEPIADVRGHPAWRATLPPGAVQPGDGGEWDVERRRIFWQEAPGVIATVETWGTDYDMAVLLDVAEGLRPAPDAEWAEMRVATGAAAGFAPAA
jgi:hypothetical protein